MFAAEPPLSSVPPAVVRQPEPVAEPVEHLQLELRRAGGLHPRPRVDVAGARDEVAERAGPRARERDEREERRDARRGS